MTATLADDLTFGIELETTIPAGIIAVGGYHAGRQIPGLPDGWQSQSDSSIVCPIGHVSCEVVSPILKGADGLAQVKKVCEWLQAIGAKVNRSTGVHVHVGWAGDENSLKRLASYVANYEKALYAASGTKSREEGHYCRPIREDYAYKNRFVEGRSDYPITDRYRLLNLRNLQTKGTVEFRVFSGTINAGKAIGYIRIALALVEKAIMTARPPKWAPAKVVESSPCYRKGEGQTEMARLLYGIGWTKGDQKRPLGAVEAEGLPTVADSKAEMIRLARKYDGLDLPVAAPVVVEVADYESWTTDQGAAWESTLRPGQVIRITSGSTVTTATFRRRWPKNLLVQVDGSNRLMIPRANNSIRSTTLRATPNR
jgi:hypothetical protein